MTKVQLKEAEGVTKVLLKEDEGYVKVRPPQDIWDWFSNSKLNILIFTVFKYLFQLN